MPSQPTTGIRQPSIAIWLIGAISPLMFGMVSGPCMAEDVAAQVLTIDGMKIDGELQELARTELVIESRDSVHHLAFEDLLEVTCVGHKPGNDSGGSLLFLTSGDRLCVDVLHVRDDAIVCRWPGNGEDLEFQIAIESVTGVLLQTELNERVRESIERELQQVEFEDDVLMLTDGDRLTGVLDGLDRQACRCETPVGFLEVSRSRVRAIGLNSTLQAVPEPTAFAIVVTLVDGSWVTACEAEWDKASLLRSRLVTGTDLPIPFRNIASICFHGSQVQSLSELDPAEVSMTPFIGNETPFRLDRNVRGGPLKVRGQTFARGLGMRPRTEIVYALNSRYSAFHALIGIDDAAGGQGHAVFSIDLDGVRAYESGPVTGRDEPQRIDSLNLEQVQLMTVSVDFGARGDVGDLANWCRPVLVRQRSSHD